MMATLALINPGTLFLQFFTHQLCHFSSRVACCSKVFFSYPSIMIMMVYFAHKSKSVYNLLTCTTIV